MHDLTWLLATSFIREVQNLEWLDNLVLVKKKNGKWRMYDKYTILNKACPKDPLPLPHIDQVVNSLVACETFCFLDMSSRYH